MLVRDIPDTAHGRLRMVEATAWLAALELRQHRPEAALVCEAIEILVEVLSTLAVDRDNTHVKVAAFVAHALRQYQCDPSLHGMLEAVAEAADGSDSEASGCRRRSSRQERDGALAGAPCRGAGASRQGVTRSWQVIGNRCFRLCLRGSNGRQGIANDHAKRVGADHAEPQRVPRNRA